MDAVHERHQVGGAVGQAQAERALIELDRGVDIGGEGQDMRQPAPPHRRPLGADRGAGSAGWRRRPLAFRLLMGRHLGPDLDLDQDVFGIAEPEAVAREAGRRIDQLDAAALDTRLQPRQILGVTAEREMMQRFGLALDNRAPAVLVAEGHDRQSVAVARDVETEIAVELLRDIGVGHRHTNWSSECTPSAPASVVGGT